MSNRESSVVLIDLWTDTNRGDCALQLGLIGMARRKWPRAKLVGVFRFGTNEIDEALNEIGFTSGSLDRFFGGVRRTYYSASNFHLLNGVLGKLISLYSFLEMFFFLSVFILKMDFLLPHKKREVLRAIKSADVVIWKGKNFRDYGGLGGLSRQMTLLSAGWLAASLNNNVHCVNASIWPMANRIEAWLLRKTLSKCKSISVREPGSLNAIKRLGIENIPIHFAQDLSFYCLRHMGDPHIASAIDDERHYDYDVAFTITQWGGDAAQAIYVSTLQSCMEQLRKLGARKFVVVPQVTRAAESNAKLIEAMRKMAAGISDISLETIDGSPGIEELLNIYASARLLIGTRMHSCVFAMAVGTPFVAIAYDAGSKWGILSQFWPERFIFGYDSDSKSIVGAALELYSESKEIVLAAKKRFEKLADESFENVKSIH